MDIADLRLFAAVCEGGSIAAAARAERISPSSASRRIATMEATLGARLLLRTTRSLAPTEAGIALLARAKSLLDGWARMEEDIAALQGQPSGPVHIASNDYAATTYLPRLLAGVCLRYPRLRPQLSIAIEPVRLLDGGCDIAVHAGRRPAADLVGRKVWEYQRRLVAAPSYLARRGTPQSPAILADHACLTHTVSEPDAWCFEAPSGDIVVQPITASIAADSWSALRELALAGAGIARLADALVRDMLADGRLVEVMPSLRSVYPDGEPPALWVLSARRDLPLRARVVIDHLVAGLLAMRRSMPVGPYPALGSL